ncbi:hypothetical protein EV175_003186 [Coemansia sp. RSA 1933]|nr:hypothetical protein EV175_003186 [Coemansia sp. RSA 1933]
MTEHNATPRAAQAQRTIAITLEQAFTNLSSVGKEQWSSQSAASLYYLCFVWPPRPIAQRYVELHKDLFVVTPDRVWQTANRLVRKLWAGSENDGWNAGSRNISLINHVEIAFATLTYHMTMTARQNTAKTAHIRLVEQYSGYIRGETHSLAENLAANEKSNLRVNSVVALAILLGVPMHGVAETTASNEYLPKTQQRNLPVLLGIGSVQYGSTAWLRVADSLLHESMGSLLSCAGLSQGGDTDDTNLGYTQAEVDDVRVAHVSSFVLGGLFAQSARAMNLLSLTDDVSAATLSGGSSAEDESLQRPGVDNRDGLSGVDDQAATAMDEEPKSLGHLPAPTSWCRAVWESIGDLSRSMVVSDGAISSLVECKMAMLLLSILRMERPFPVVDMQTIFSSVLYSYILDLRAGGSNDKAARLFPVVALLLRVSSKLGSISHSARVTGLGSILKLAGFPSGKRERKGDYLDPAIRRLISTDARWAEERLEIALQKTLPLYLQKSEPVQVEEVVESDAQCMFRLMSKVGIQESQTVSVCTKLLVHVFSKVGKACPAVVALEIMFLSTLETHLSTMTGKGVQEKVAAKINYLIYDDLAVMATDYIAEEEAMLWSAVGIIYSCTDADAASSIRAKYNDPSDMTDFVRIVETMSVILRHKMAGHSRIVQNTSDGPENYLSSNIVDMWIQLAFVEWTFYINGAHAPKITRLNRCLQNVALAMFDWRRSVGGGQFGVGDACRLIIQGLDMAILAVTKCYPSVSRKSASKDSACISDPTGTVVAGTFAYWILPLLTGRCYSSPSLPNDSTNDPLSTLIVSAVFACGEVLEYVNLASRRLHAGPTIGPDAETPNEQQFSVQLRTRIQRLLELLSHSPVKRILQSVLSDLAVLGMLPTSDLSSVL